MKSNETFSFKDETRLNVERAKKPWTDQVKCTLVSGYR